MNLNSRNTFPVTSRTTSSRASPCQTLTNLLVLQGFTDSTFCLL